MNELYIIFMDLLPLIIMCILVFISLSVLLRNRSPKEIRLVSGSLYIDCKHNNDGPDPCNHSIKKIDPIVISDLGDGFFTNK